MGDLMEMYIGEDSVSIYDMLGAVAVCVLLLGVLLVILKQIPKLFNNVKRRITDLD